MARLVESVTEIIGPTQSLKRELESPPENGFEETQKKRGVCTNTIVSTHRPLGNFLQFLALEPRDAEGFL